MQGQKRDSIAPDTPPGSQGSQAGSVFGKGARSLSLEKGDREIQLKPVDEGRLHLPFEGIPFPRQLELPEGLELHLLHGYPREQPARQPVISRRKRNLRVMRITGIP